MHIRIPPLYEMPTLASNPTHYKVANSNISNFDHALSHWFPARRSSHAGADKTTGHWRRIPGAMCIKVPPLYEMPTLGSNRTHCKAANSNIYNFDQALSHWFPTKRSSHAGADKTTRQWTRPSQRKMWSSPGHWKTSLSLSKGTALLSPDAHHRCTRCPV